MRTCSWPGLILMTALGLAACDDDPHYPAGTPPGGTPPGGNGRVDAGVTFADAGGVATITGTLCEVADVRAPGTCVAIPRAGLDVEARATDGTVLATTTSDALGHFALGLAALEAQVVLVADDALPTGYHKGARLVTVPGTVVSGVALPLVTKQRFADIVVGSNEAVLQGHGVVVAALSHAGAGLAGVLVDALLPSGRPTYYDTIDAPDVFSQIGPTTASGVVLWFDVPATSQATYTVHLDDLTTALGTTVVVGDAVVFTSATF